MAEMATTKRKASVHFRILDLPAELRNYVYEYTLYHDRSCRHFGNTNILLTCRQVHHEAKDLVFEHSAFSFTVSTEGVTPEIDGTAPYDGNTFSTQQMRAIDDSRVHLSGDLARGLGAASRLGVETIYDALPQTMLKVARINLEIATGCAYLAQRIIYALTSKLNSPQTRCSQLHLHFTPRPQDELNVDDPWQGAYDSLMKLPQHISVDLGKTLCPEHVYDLKRTLHDYRMSPDSYVRLCCTKNGKAHPSVPHFAKANTIARFKRARLLAGGLITDKEARFKEAHYAGDHKTREEIGRFWIEIKKRFNNVAQHLRKLDYWFSLELEHDDLIDLEMVVRWATAVTKGRAIDEKRLKKGFDAKRQDRAKLSEWKEALDEEFKQEYLRSERV